MKSLLLLFSPSIVLALWAIVWVLGVQGNFVIGVGLTVLALTAFLAERERIRLRREMRDKAGRQL